MDNGKLFNSCYGADPSVFAEKVIITPFISLERFKGYCNVRSVFKGALYSGFTAEKKGEDVTVIWSGIGDRLAGDAVLLLRQTRAKNVLFAGTCGGLNDCGIGDLLVAEGAFSGEGFSRYYDKDFSMAKVFKEEGLICADSLWSKKLLRFLKENTKNELILKNGNIFTVGSLVAEIPGNLEYIQKKGFKGIEMELSAVFRAAEVAGLKAAGLVMVSDRPLEKGIGEELSSKEREAFKKGLADVLRLAMDFCCIE